MNDPDSMANFRRLTTTPVETLPATLQSLETKQMRAQSPMYEQRKSLFFNKQTTREISEEDKLASMAKRRRLTLTRGTERTKKMRGLWKKVRSEFISVGKFSTLHNMVNKRRYGIDIRADFKVKEKVTGIARLILIPNKGFQKVWGIIICLLLFYTITFLPFQVTFYSDVSSTTLIYLDYTIQSFFGVDIILNFFTAYYDQYERLVTDFRKISWHYMKTWFIFDVLATFPTQLVIDDIWKKPSYNQFVRLARIPRMLRLLSAMRFIKAIKMISLVRYRATLSHVAFVLRMNAVLKRTLILLFVLLLMTHIFACIWYFEARTNTLEDRFWTDVGHINEMTTFDAYIRSLSWSVQTVTSLGMGNIVPINLAERIITMFWMALGNIFFAIFTGNVQITAESESKSLQSIKARSAIFEEFATQSELPIELSRRVNAWIAFKYKDMKQMTFLNEMDFIDELPDFFRQKILLHLSSMLMELFPFLNEQPKEMIVKYGRKFIIHRFLPGEDVFLDKGHAEEVFFVSSGRLVRLNQSGMVISSYVSGDILGAREVINKQRRVTSAKSKVFSVVFRIDQDTFRAIIREYPETARFINDVQSKRLKMEYSNPAESKPRRGSQVTHWPFSRNCRLS